MSFSKIPVKGSRQICMIKWPTTRWNGDIVYLNPGVPEDHKDGKEEKKVVNLNPYSKAKDEAIDLVGEDYFKQGRKGRLVTQKDMEIVKAALEGEFGDGDGGDLDWSSPEAKRYLNKRVEDARREVKSRRRDFDLEAPGWCQPLMDDTGRECCFIVGKSKSGKSTFAAWKMLSYRHQFPHNKIWLVVSPKVEGDTAFSGIDGIEKMPLDQKFIDAVNKDELELANCLVCFDDVDSISNDKLKKAVWKVRQELLETGRHSTTYVLNTSHIFRGGKATHAANNEATSIVLFPKSGEKYHMKDVSEFVLLCLTRCQYLKTYGGLDKDQIDRVMNLGSRWVELVTSAPSFVLHERGGFFL